MWFKLVFCDYFCLALGWIRKHNKHDSYKWHFNEHSYNTQFSTLSFGMFENSLTLLVTNTAFINKACMPINKSNGPIVCPFCLRYVLISPYRGAASFGKSIISIGAKNSFNASWFLVLWVLFETPNCSSQNVTAEIPISPMGMVLSLSNTHCGDCLMMYMHILVSKRKGVNRNRPFPVLAPGLARP